MEDSLVQSQPPVEIQPNPTKPWLKIALFACLGLILVSGLLFASYQLGKRQAQFFPQVFTPTPTAFPAHEEFVSPPFKIDTHLLPADWEIYKDPKYNYQISYLKNWKIGGVKYQSTGIYDSTPSYEGILFEDPERTVRVIVRVEKNPKKLDIVSYLTKFPAAETAYIGPVEEAEKEQRKIAERMVRDSLKIDVDSQTAFKFDNLPTPLPSTEVLFLKEELALRFVLMSLQFSTRLPIPDTYQNVFNLMLSTFKFLDQSQTDETANWKTYTSKKYDRCQPKRCQRISFTPYFFSFKPLRLFYI
jgi:hypothetical protein